MHKDNTPPKEFGYEFQFTPDTVTMYKVYKDGTRKEEEPLDIPLELAPNLAQVILVTQRAAEFAFFAKKSQEN